MSHSLEQLEASIDQDYVVLVHRKKKVTTREELEKLSSEELVIRVLALQAHNTQLLNLLKKEHAAHNAAVEALAESSNGSASSTGAQSKAQEDGGEPTQRKFHFKTSHKRHILLKFYYLGWDYQGFTSQEHTTQTVEHHLFKALTKTCLIETRETSNYHRCGRTDKGVSAFSQVISIDVRSKFAPEHQMSEESLKNEMNYCEALNRVLPANIKCLSWAPCENAAYSARFDCKKRSYRYFFPRGSMNIEAMRAACKHLVGINDFRNLCKMDVQNGVVEFIREIKGADVHLASKSLRDPAYDMFYMELIGKAYLWHQVRCIMAILLLVGQEQEHPDVLAELMDVNKNPCTPQYSMASDLALNLWNVEYKDESDTDENGVQFKSVQWQYDELNMRRLIIVLQAQWTTSSVQATMMQEMLCNIQAVYEGVNKWPRISTQQHCLLEGSRAKKYQPLMERVKCESLQNRIAHFAKKRRIELQCVKDESATAMTTDDTEEC